MEYDQKLISDILDLIFELAVKSEKKVFILENLKTKNMTRSASGSVEEPGKQVAQKAGLNREILNIGWHRIENFLKYKAIKNGKLLIKVSPYKTSQECSNCEYTHEDNRPAQEVFNCGKCGYQDNADKNASKVLENRAIKLILDSGTEFSDSDILHKSEKSAVTKRKISGLPETTRKKRKVESTHSEASWL